MKTKFLLPVLAAIFAIGMSFTTVNSVGDLNTDYYLEDGVLKPIGMELNCGIGNITCQVKFGDDGPYDVYDSASSEEPKKGNGSIIHL